MDNKRPKEIVHGYEIKESIVFENNRGFALAENPNAVQPFVTWMFTEDDNGKHNYEWGHYTKDRDAARRDYADRIAEYQKDYGMAEKGNYKYYSTQRPVDIGTFPKTAEVKPVRIVNFDTRERVERGHYQAWGYLEYAAPLTQKQIDDYELKAAPGNPDVKARMREQTQVVGEWEEQRKVSGSMRFTEWIPDVDTYISKSYITPEQMEQRYNQAIEAQTRAAQKPRRIAEQLAEAEKKVERSTEPPSADKKIKREER